MPTTATPVDGITTSDDVTADTWSDGTVTLDVDGQQITLTRAQAQAAMAALGWALATS